jgi:hypothetical protein
MMQDFFCLPCCIVRNAFGAGKQFRAKQFCKYPWLREHFLSGYTCGDQLNALAESRHSYLLPFLIF